MGLAWAMIWWACVIGEAARIGEPGEVAFVRIEIADGVFVGDGGHQTIAAFIGLADGHDFDALGGGGEGAIVAGDIGDVGEVLGRADVVAEDVLGGGNSGRFGQMVYQRAHELGPGGPLFDELGVLLILRLLHLGQRCDGGGRGEDGNYNDA